jgi:hypothetical protein
MSDTPTHARRHDHAPVHAGHAARQKLVFLKRESKIERSQKRKKENVKSQIS